MSCLLARWFVPLTTVLLLTACGDDPAIAPDVPSWANVAPEQIAEAKKHGVPVAFENDLGMRFVLIPAGTFLMGSPEDEVGRGDDETQHEVTLTKPFYMQITEVTNRMYWLFEPLHENMPYGDRDRDGEARPVTVWRAGARGFAWWLSVSDADRKYRLPGEIEWQRAASAGSESGFWWGREVTEAWRHENVGDQSLARHYRRFPLGAQFEFLEADDGCAWTADVASFPPNHWGLYDMQGNLRELCREWRRIAEVEVAPFHERFEVRCCGHSFESEVKELSRNACGWFNPGLHYGPIGFRLVSPLPEQDE